MIDLASLSVLTLSLVLASIVVSGLLHGALGFGFPMTVMPLLALILDIQSAIFITLIPTIVLNIISITTSGPIGREVLKYWPLVIFIIVGSMIGSHLLIMFDADTFKLLLAFIIFFYLASLKRKLRIFSWVNDFPKLSVGVFGLASGFTSGAVSVMVPVIIIYAFEVGLVGTAIMVQVMNIAFLAGKTTQLIVFSYSSLIDKQFLLMSIPFSVVSAGSLLIGMKVRDKLDVETYKNIVMKVLFIMAVLMVVQYFVK